MNAARERRAALESLTLIKKGETPMTYHVYKDAAGEWRWRLVATNKQTIADSGEGYVDKRDCLAAIELVKNSRDAPVEEDD